MAIAIIIWICDLKERFKNSKSGADTHYLSGIDFVEHSCSSLLSSCAGMCPFMLCTLSPEAAKVALISSKQVRSEGRWPAPGSCENPFCRSVGADLSKGRRSPRSVRLTFLKHSKLFMKEPKERWFCMWVDRVRGGGACGCQEGVKVEVFEKCEEQQGR